MVITMTNKKKRGRPKDKTLKELIPDFKNDTEIKDYLIQQGIYINFLMVQSALKKNNIKNPTISRAKTYERKAALDGLKITESMINNKTLDELKAKFEAFEMGLLTNNAEAKFEFEKMVDEFEKIQQN